MKYLMTLLKKCRMPLAVLIIILAILFSTFRALTPWAKQYKGDVEAHLSTLLGQPVSINDLETSWYWFEPVLKMDKVRLSDSQDHVLQLNKLLIGIDLIGSLWHWQIQPGVLYVDDVHLTLRQIHNHWDVDGLSQTKQVMTFEPTAYLPVLSWLLAQEKIIIKNVSAVVHFNDGSVLPFDAVNFTAVHAYGHYRLQGRAKLAQIIPTALSVIADLQLNPSAPSKASGHAYVSVQHFIPTQWQGFLPKTAYHIKGGEGSLELWADLAKGHVAALQAKLHIQDVAWTEDGRPKPRFIQLLHANLAWVLTRDGWQLSGDQIQMHAGGVRWPDNALRLDYKQSQQTYALFVKTVLLQSVLDSDDVHRFAWPDNVRTVLDMQPRGELHDMQVVLKDSHIDSLLTRFTHFGWQGHDEIPAVSQISGVLAWQPTEGRLDLDGEDTVIKPRNLPALTFNLFNVALDWKELNRGLRINMDHFVLSHPNLVLSARGALDNPALPATNNLTLTAEFSANQAKKFLAYIPARYLKPKLNQWLKHDVKRVEKVSGRILVNGALTDFPFDNTPGEFSIDSHVSGVDVLITERWPLNRDIDADLRVNKRTLEADIYQADLHGVLIDKISLVINGIGAGREALLLHGNLEAPADKIKAYLFASPLRQRLSTLQWLDVVDSLGLDLSLEIPLYPESDHVFARGALVFDNNQANVHHTPNDIVLDGVSGTLQFDENGVTEGGLQGTIAGDPIAMQVQSFFEPEPYTAVNIEANTTIDFLRKTLALPLFALMDGHLKLHSLFTLYNSPTKLDHMHLDTSLDGAAIDLPTPLGKSAAESVPLVIDAEFNPKKAVELHLNYANRLSGDLWFAHAKDTFLLRRGELRFGEGEATLPTQMGVNVVGSLPVFDLQQWRRVLAKMPADKSLYPVMNSLQLVDMRVDDMHIFDHQYNGLNVLARKITGDDWSIKLLEKKDEADKPLVAPVADLHYQPTTNLLSGHFERLFFNKLATKNQTINQSKTSLNPEDIPNLDITVGELQLGDVDAGNVTLKSTSTKTDWILNQCVIQSPDYQLSVQGDWSKKGNLNNTTLRAGLKIENLSKSLERWHVTPVVDAHQGDVQFSGGWTGAFNDFSLDKVVGDMHITLKDGRISHLSRETEEKLGLGKLLSILSLQTIPRRLKLDFSDLSEQGYSFDVFKGSFNVHHGVMSTDDSYIDGPVAYASMNGDLDLSKRLYDVNLRVTPYITASLPIVATIAGGPIAGIAAWVASKIINKGMQKISGYTYKISGPWLDPVVQQVSIYRKK